MKQRITNKQRVYVLAGPTAAGKSDVVHWLALQQQMNVLSADSMAVYEHMDIGTAKPDIREKQEVRYYGVDLVPPDTTFSVADYILYVKQQVLDPALIVCGGSGLYIKCLLSGLNSNPPPDPIFRERMARILDEEGIQGLQTYARTNAPEAYGMIQDKKNPRRIIRALENSLQPVYEKSWNHNTAQKHKLVGLRWERTVLALRIDTRVRKMYSNGLLDEAEHLMVHYPKLSVTAMQSIGYREAFSVLNGELSCEEAIAQTCCRTRQLAKRQMTWYNHQFDMQWIDMDVHSDVQETVAQVWSLWHRLPDTSIYYKEKD